jgi:hypothetical protein
MNDREWLATLGEYSSRLRILAGAIVERVSTILAHDRSVLLTDIQRLNRQSAELKQRVDDLEAARERAVEGKPGDE